MKYRTTLSIYVVQSCVCVLCLQDSSGYTGLHVAIQTKQPLCCHVLLGHPSLDLTIKNEAGNTAFACALEARDNEVGKAILQREPNAAEQVGWLHNVCICVKIT